MRVEGWPRLADGQQLGEVTGVAVDSHNHVFVFHRANRDWSGDMSQHGIQQSTILMIDGDTGDILAEWGRGKFVIPHGISIDKHDNVWVTDVGTHQVHKFTNDGEHLLTFGETGIAGNSPSLFAGPTDVAFLSDGSVIVSDGYDNTRLVKYRPDGTFLTEWGEPGKSSGQFNLPHGLAVNADDQIFVIDRGNARVKIFDKDGAFIDQWKGRQLGRPYGIDVAANGDVFVVEAGWQDRSVVIKLNSEGSLISRFTTAIRGDRALMGHDIAVGDDGAIYVADVFAKRVQKFVKRTDDNHAGDYHPHTSKMADGDGIQ